MGCRLWGVLVLVTFSSNHIARGDVRQAYYKRIPHFEFANSTCINMSTSGSEKECACACNLDPGCTSMNLDPVLKTCNKNIGDIYTFGAPPLIPSSSVDYLGKVKDDVTEGNWILAYRAQAGNMDRLKEYYQNTGLRNDEDMTKLNLTSISKIGDKTSSHYRSRWIDLWPSSDIDQVRLEMYKDGSSVVQMIFNGTGSNNEDWFSFNRLVSSTYTDLTSEPSHFSLQGLGRFAFYVSEGPSAACTQLAWIIPQSKSATRCSWNKAEYPTLIYSKGTTKGNFNNGDHDYADVMAIFLKFK